MIDKVKAQKAATSALREIGTAYVQVDDKVYERAQKRLTDDAWGKKLPGYVGTNEPDYYFEAAVHECVQTVVTTLESGAASPSVLLEEGGALDLAPSPEAMAIYHAFATEKPIYLIDDTLADLLAIDDLRPALAAGFESHLPKCAYIATPLRLTDSATGELFEAPGCFVVVVDEIGEDETTWRKRVVIAAVEDARRPRIVVASIPPSGSETQLPAAHLETALVTAAMPFIAYLAREDADIVADPAPRRGSASATLYFVGQREQASNRRQLLLHQNTSKAA